jgi:hypothetical protein
MVFSGTVTSDFLKYLPIDLDNKEKLIDHSASDFATLREALINYAKAVYPLDYTNFSESDFGVMLIELMAALGHINSYKADFLVNENYLRTARNRSSVKNLLELVGVRLKGPISAAANASITINSIPDSVGTSVSSCLIPAANRVVSITSPEDNGALTFTLYKVNSDGTVNLENLSNDLTFTVSATAASTVIITDAVLLEGSLVIESGQFQSPDVIKSVVLSQFPYVEKSAQVFVQGNTQTNGIYTEEENIYYASGASDKIFQVITDEDFTARILFGDSTIGQSPAVGDNYTVSYRIGGGSRGNIASEYINAPISIILSNGATSGLADGTLENTTPGTGGSDAETITHAKRYAPLSFRRQDRLVTLIDYKSFINTFISNYGSTGKANAVVRRAYSSANIIDLFVLEKASNTQLRKATPEYKRQLLEALQEKKMLTDEPVIVDGLIRTLDVFITATVDSKFKKFENEIRGKIRNRILNYFNVDNTDFGESFIPQDLIKSIIEIEEVRYATIDNVEGVIKIDFNEIIQLNNLTIKFNYL